jgi:hypothetical protein
MGNTIYQGYQGLSAELQNGYTQFDDVYCPLTSIIITQTTLCSEHSLNHEQILRTPQHNVGRGVKNHAIYLISVVMQSENYCVATSMCMNHTA